jgi:elongation factor 1-alpha
MALVLNIAFIGHHNSGKSTVVGHLLELEGRFTRRHYENAARQARELGRATSVYSFLINTARDSRERNMGCKNNYIWYKDEVLNSVLIDVPGASQFAKIAQYGIFYGDVAVLVVSAAPNEFEIGCKKSGQTLHHSRLAYTMGIKQLLVCVTKLDLIPNSFMQQERFNQIQTRLRKRLAAIHFREDSLRFVPVSGQTGVNLQESLQGYSWWNGPSLKESLQTFTPIEHKIEKPLRISIARVERVRGIGMVYQGKILSGVLHTGMSLTIFPIGFTSQVKSMQINFEDVTVAHAGQIVGICFVDHSSVPEKFSRRLAHGFIAAEPQEPLDTIKSLEVKLIIIDNTPPIKPGYSGSSVFCHNSNVPCVWSDILSTQDPKTGRLLSTKTTKLEMGDHANVVITFLHEALLCEKYSEFPFLGRVTFRDFGRTIAVGIVTDIKYRSHTGSGSVTKAAM